MRSDTKIPKCHMCGKGPFENLREWVNHRCDRAMSSDTPTPRTRFEIDRCQNELGAIEVGPFIALSKTLERELAEAKMELAEYRASTDPHYVDELAALKAELAEARAEIERLQSIIDKYGEIL